MNNSIKKLAVIGVTSSVVLSSVGAYALAGEEAELPAEPEEVKEEKETEAEATEDREVKDETAYVFTDATGGVKKILVSDWLTDAEDGGEDAYTMEQTEAQAPVDIRITYTLDGEEITPEDLAGKSGHVTIRFDYTNQVYEETVIDGETVKIYVPFAVLTGMVLNNEHFTNISVTNGKCINDGSRQVVIGYALPGMQESLDLDEEKLKIPDYMEVEADVQEFELGMTLSIATARMLNSIDVDDIDSFDELSDAMDDLKDAMEQLIDGSSELADGLDTLLESTGDLSDGVDDLESGAQELLDGANDLDDGAQDLMDGAQTLLDGANDLDDGAQSLQDGAKALADGLTEITANNEDLTNGAAQVYESLLRVAQTQIEAAGQSIETMTIDNYDTVLEDLLSSLSDEGIYAQARAKVTAAVDEMGDSLYATYIEQNADSIYLQYVMSMADDLYVQYVGSSEAAELLTEEQKQQILTGAIDLLSDEQKDQIRAGALATLTADQKAQIHEGAIAQAMESEEVSSQIRQAKESAAQLQGVLDQLNSFGTFYEGILTYTEAVQQAADGASELYDGTVTLKDGTSALADGASDLHDGTVTLKDGISALADGASELHDGTVTLKDSVPDLVDGITELDNGGRELADGIQEFNEEGVQKIIDAVEGDLSTMLDRLKAVRDAGKDYTFLAQEGTAGTGDVKFIYRTDSIR